MVKVKTLEDFRDYPKPSDFEVSAGELKQEAIKWIKELRDYKFYCVVCEKFECDCGSSDCFKPKKENIESWIKHFFNIIEGDLKSN